ncbi:MAG: valine--tRNA ligase [Candidatus Komeilibacteria bacterium RIFOXYC1_FULL_37_11]|uniref:Valine--tRNA ligase n=1 Tax=Candidatus Komeilibacteria bacterium RIFOXYC1_FULL_37_11 TaxID=1798555 RepID=A0A1G2BXN8_9BACT|nr:MAG: valine--tRNA ligase [Candidatus Komeilibacteria bacterium RIFOXYC1_FULL_37_11]OGY95175.1 MAG: valine--tRNA ligase [Candidatus Komeilibacteria bacterium RIFOXYD1_FULL_37_29]
MPKKLEEMAKAYEPGKYEAEIYKTWEKSGFFNPDNLKTRGKPFVISMPPPNATGILHLGHASTFAYEDLMVRYHRLKGDKTLWVPGTDHAAIATQTKVEKILAAEGSGREKLGRDKFLTRVKQFVAQSQDTIRNQTRKMGSSCDWSRERYTLDEGLSQAVNEAFVRMYNDGLIYRGNRIVNWCPRCGSTLADDEVEYIEKKTPFYYFKYGPVTIGTARPETKFADKIIVVHPDDERYQDIIGKEFEVEWIDGKIKARVIADPIADKEKGTGAMTITPAHSFVDFDLAKKYNLPIEQIIDKDGKLTKAAGQFVGLSVMEGRKKVVEILESKGLVEKIDYDYIHNLSVCYRCETPVEPLTSEQWFVAVDKKIPGRNKTLKQLATKVVKSGQIKILPERFNKIYYHWMDNLHDWCISRQIWWGHRIPVWYDSEGKAIVAIDKKSAELQAKGKKLRQDEDTLDTWFSSALWTFSTLGWPAKTEDFKKFHPTSVMETGYDIIFFWVARMILMSEYLLKDKPFETVYLHGMIRDKEGRKMSKSLGNGIDPLDMIAKFGTDALRLSLIIGSAPGADLRLYEEKIAGYRNFVNKLWNISRFIFTSVKAVKRINKQPKAKTLADRWILAEFNQLIKQVTGDLEEYRFSSAGEKLYEFSWSKLADWYLEIAKIEKSKDDILLYILERLLILSHPFTPFVTELIWRQFGSGTLLMVDKWPRASKFDDKIMADFSELKELIVAIRNIKAANKIAPTDFPDCYIVSEFLDKEYLALAAQMSRVNLVETKLELEPIMINSSQVYINLKRELSNKERQSLEQYIKNTQDKLANQDFMAHAPQKVIADIQKKLAEAKQKLQ